MEPEQQQCKGDASPPDASEFNADGLSVASRVWGSIDGKEVYRVDMKTAHGFRASFTTYGATMVSLMAGDKEGKSQELTLQYDTLEGVRQGDSFYGSTIGRVCNRIGGASFTVDGKEYKLEQNDGPNCLHSGNNALDKMLWNHETFECPGGVGVRFMYDSPDGEQGFPWVMAIKVTFMIKAGKQPGTGELFSEFEVKSSADTQSSSGAVPCPINLTNHAYWNLSGSFRRSIRDQILRLRCDRYLPLDEHSVPTGEIALVCGTFYDFTKERALGEAIDGLGGDPPGIDNCLVIVDTSDGGEAKAVGDDDELPFMAHLRDPESGRTLDLFGTHPSVQVYTSNYLSQDVADRPHLQHNAVCLETQHFPDAVNKDAWRDSVLLPPGATYLHRSRHVFGVCD